MAEDTLRLHRLGPPAPVASVEDLVAHVMVSVVVSREVAAAAVGVSAAQTEDFEVVAAAALVLVLVVAAIVASANKTVMRLPMPQPDQDPTVDLGDLGTAIGTVTVTEPVVGIHALAPAHMMTDLVDRRHDTSAAAIDEQAPTSSPFVTDASSTANTTATTEKTRIGNVGTRVATKTHASFAVTRSALLGTTPRCLGGYVPSSRFTQLLFRLFILLPAFCHQG